jgi:phospholipid/cholesterol/gamma-HCH transport system permease protein
VASAFEIIADPVARLGRAVIGSIESLGAVTVLLRQTLYWCVVGPFTGQTRYRRLVFPLMRQIGVLSLAIVCLVAFLVGAILVMQTADKFREFGSIGFVAPTVCVAIVRELGPLMTAIVIAGRVGAAFTAGLGSMVINEEVLALRTMGINPIGYLVAPRFIAICVMLPCLTAFSYLLGIAGGVTVGVLQFQIPFWTYINSTINYLDLTDLLAGLVKATVFGALICMVACYNALTVRGGPEGVGRNTMISVVNSLVSIIIADAFIGAFLSNYIYSR